MATGAAVAAAGRQVINLQADGSAMYTLQVRAMCMCEGPI
jgi:thiamine pyrophosphate-dependent acetolactate synthase large subunit-like protein